MPYIKADEHRKMVAELKALRLYKKNNHNADGLKIVNKALLKSKTKTIIKKVIVDKDDNDFVPKAQLYRERVKRQRAEAKLRHLEQIVKSLPKDQGEYLDFAKDALTKYKAKEQLIKELLYNNTKYYKQLRSAQIKYNTLYYSKIKGGVGVDAKSFIPYSQILPRPPPVKDHRVR